MAILRLHERGGFGEVYVGHDPELDRPVAIKVPKVHCEPDEIDGFLAEARKLARLRHPGVVKDHVAADEARERSVVEWRCSPYYQLSAFFPAIDYFGRTLGLDEDETGPARLARLVQHLAQYGRLLSVRQDAEVELVAEAARRERRRGLHAKRDEALAVDRGAQLCEHGGEGGLAVEERAAERGKQVRIEDPLTARPGQEDGAPIRSGPSTHGTPRSFSCSPARCDSCAAAIPAR